MNLIIYFTTIECCEHIKVLLCCKSTKKQQTLLDKWNHWSDTDKHGHNVKCCLENLWKQWSLMTWSSVVFFQNQIFPRRARHGGEWVMSKKLHSPKNKQRLMFKHLTWSMPHQWTAWMINMKCWRVISVMTLHLPSLCICNQVTLF